MVTSDLDEEGRGPRIGAGEAVHRREGPERMALSVEEAAESLRVSRRHFDRHIKPHLRVVPAGRRIVVPGRELERYLHERAV
jgi:excisionase family DNA binding protein